MYFGLHARSPRVPLRADNLHRRMEFERADCVETKQISAFAPRDIPPHDKERKNSWWISYFDRVSLTDRVREREARRYGTYLETLEAHQTFIHRPVSPAERQEDSSTENQEKQLVKSVTAARNTLLPRTQMILALKRQGWVEFVD